MLGLSPSSGERGDDIFGPDTEIYINPMDIQGVPGGMLKTSGERGPGG
jgi:hypothetical protein